ncbi:sulfotransferase family protein [Desulfobacter latus]|uniref:Sulfotransferase n=1 Tax=Desulfobacter latus TaxID=2292 RepID=A0A850T4E3_9BACT|nr:sulfotransferase [Desulfobacter latus]NWH03705.1 sulfotransferase [Desulfobacter latus]
MEKFVVAGIQRTGTTLIRTTLDKHSQCRCFGETFLFKKGRGGKLEGSYRRFINQNKYRRLLAHYLSRKKLVDEYLSSFFDKYQEYEAVGFKVMGTQVKQFPSIISYCQEKNIKVIFVIRENYLRTYLSRLSLQQNRIPHSNKKIAVKKVKVPVRSLIAKLKKIQKESLWPERAFSGNPIIKVTYEDFVSNKTKELERIFNFLSVEPQAEIESDLVKVNPNNLQDYVVNYEEVKNRLNGTEFECFFY